MRLPAHHSPHFELVQLVPVMGQRMANRCWSPALARMRFPLASPLVLRPEPPWGLEVAEVAEVAEQAAPT